MFACYVAAHVHMHSTYVYVQEIQVNATLTWSHLCLPLPSQGRSCYFDELHGNKRALGKVLTHPTERTPHAARHTMFEIHTYTCTYVRMYVCTGTVCTYVLTYAQGQYVRTYVRMHRDSMYVRTYVCTGTVCTYVRTYAQGQYVRTYLRIETVRTIRRCISRL